MCMVPVERTPDWWMVRADVIEWLRGCGSLRFHAILSDPPYGWAFMGREWDKFKSPKAFQHWVTEWASLLIEKALYPGAVCLFFGGPRSEHRLACGLEDAGFSIDDKLCHLFGSGFPKSYNVGQAVEKQITTGRSRRPDRDLGGRTRHRWSGDKKGTLIADTGGQIEVATKEGKRFSGYGTALKPAYQSIILARAPRKRKTYAQLALEYGTGSLWIDGARIGHNEPLKLTERHAPRYSGCVMANGQRGGKNSNIGSANPQGRWPANLLLSHTERCERRGVKKVRGGYLDYDCSYTGSNPVRFLSKGTQHRRGYASPDGLEEVEDWECSPDCSVRQLDEMSGECPSAGRYRNPDRMIDCSMDKTVVDWGSRRSIAVSAKYGNETGGASRFFYCAKVSSKERNAGLPEGMKNKHPTLKPIKLTEYLARLILPPELEEPRRLLVPFAGTGSEIAGALRAGWDEVVGIELDGEAVRIAQHRVPALVKIEFKGSRRNGRCEISKAEVEQLALAGM